MTITVEALLEERRGYVLRGLTDRVAQVDAEIERLSGVVVEDVATELGGTDVAELETAEASPDSEIETTAGRGRKRS